MNYLVLSHTGYSKINLCKLYSPHAFKQRRMWYLYQFKLIISISDFSKVASSSKVYTKAHLGSNCLWQHELLNSTFNSQNFLHEFQNVSCIILKFILDFDWFKDSLLACFNNIPITNDLIQNHMYLLYVKHNLLYVIKENVTNLTATTWKSLTMNVNKKDTRTMSLTWF